MQSHRYTLLDGMRGLAALFVVLRHSEGFLHIHAHRSYLAVDLFFVLSGFVIAHAYGNKLAMRELSLRQFIAVRLIRLYPVFLLSFLICAALYGVKILSHHDANGIGLTGLLIITALTALFLPSHAGNSNTLFPLNGPYWSLFFELLANFLYAAIYPRLNRGVRTAIITISAGIVAVITLHHGNLDYGFSWGLESLVGGMARATFGIFLGTAIHQHRTAIAAALQRISPWWAMLAIAAILSAPSVPGYDALIDLMLVACGIPLLVMVGATPHQFAPRMEKILLLLGSASYPIYLLHKPIVDVLSHSLHSSNAATSAAITVVLFAVLIWIAVTAESRFDIPARRWLTRKAALAGLTARESG